jgi:hypothetical protein
MNTKHLFLAVAVSTLMSGYALSPAMAATPNYQSVAQTSNFINSQVNQQEVALQNQAKQTASTLSFDAQNFAYYTSKHANEVIESIESHRHYDQGAVDSVAADAARQTGDVQGAAYNSTLSNQALANQRALATAQSAQNLQNLLYTPSAQGEPALNPVGTNLYVRNYTFSEPTPAPASVTMVTTAKKVALAPVGIAAKAEALSSFTKALPKVVSHG